MHDLTTLERQIGVVLDRMGGPEPMFDAVAVARVAATQPSKWRYRDLFSATRFVVAATIVALFGGFVLSGVVTLRPPAQLAPGAASPSPTTTQELLSGMVTEEVEPGVFRILDDGAGHELVKLAPIGLTVAADGSVWLLRPAHGRPSIDTPADAVFELGREGTFPFQPSTDPYAADFAVGSDDVAWLGIGDRTPGPGRPDRGGRILGSLRDSTWTYPTWPDGSTSVAEIAAARDGSVWVAQRVMDGPGPRVARIVDGEWTVLPALDDPALAGQFGNPRWGGPGYLAAADDGTAWLANGSLHGGNPTSSPNGLLHFDGVRWEVVDLPTVTHDGQRLDLSVDEPWQAGPIALGPDGTLWVYLLRSGFGTDDSHLARLDANGWSLFTARADGVPRLVVYWDREAPLAVDGTGRLWTAPRFQAPIPYLRPHVISFDGTSWRRYLDGLDVTRLGVAPDGSVFATALGRCAEDPSGQSPDGCGERGRDASEAGLYVITPGAAGAAAAGE